MKLRQEVWEKCKSKPLDLIVVGGGINGAGILRDAVMRGLNAVLLEQNDFASGTSSRSSKLIHGGLRYLETFDFKLIFEATHERKKLLHIAPQMVRPLPFVFPVYKGQRRSLTEIAAGVWLYTFLAGAHNIRFPTIYRKHKAALLEPGLSLDRLTGAALYYDAVTNDAELTLSNLRAAWNGGGMALNHANVFGLIEEGEKICGVCVKDEMTGQTHEVRSKWVVNVTGAWSDAFMKSTLKSATSRLRLTKGVHIVLEKNRVPLRHAVVMLSPKDGRVTFLIPWEEVILLGTTDTDFTGDPSNVEATKEDVQYLLEVANNYFPAARLSPADAISTFAGLRPLLSDHRSSPSQVSREHQILGEKNGLATMVGGKLTTYRQMSEELLDWVIAKTPEWQSKFKPCATDREPLPQSNTASIEERIDLAVQSEFACTLTDVLSHRMWLVHKTKDHGLSWVPTVRKSLEKALNLHPEEFAKQVKDLEQVIEKAKSGL